MCFHACLDSQNGSSDWNVRRRNMLGEEGCYLEVKR